MSEDRFEAEVSAEEWYEQEDQDQKWIAECNRLVDEALLDEHH